MGSPALERPRLINEKDNLDFAACSLSASGGVYAFLLKFPPCLLQFSLKYENIIIMHVTII